MSVIAFPLASGQMPELWFFALGLGVLVSILLG
jgi:hypothetical protein